jgi:hypothetical protein
MPRDKRFIVTRVEVEGREETRVVEVPDFDPDPWGWTRSWMSWASVCRVSTLSRR